MPSAISTAPGAKRTATSASYRRLTALGALRGFGVKVEGFGCPSEYEAAMTGRGNGV